VALIVAGDSPVDNPASSVIAQIGERSIRYAEVQCVESEPANPSARASEQRCRDYEREMFRAEIVSELYQSACALEGWSPSEADIAPHRPAFLKDDSLTRELAEKAYVLPRAVRRVFAGEELTSVYADVARALPNISLDSFRGQLKLYRSLAVVDKFLAKDPVVRFRESADRFARQVAMQEHLHQFIAQRAIANSRTYSDEADEFLQSLGKTLPIRILDSRFRLPAGREVFR